MAPALPGVRSEEICEQLGVDTVRDTVLRAQDYRKDVTEACYSFDAKMLAVEMKDKRKGSKILEDGYGRKQYSSKLIPSKYW